MLMRLQHKRPDGEMDTYHLKPGRKYYFGRGSTCELRILDLKLSRKHCLLEWVDGTWQVEDLGSTNGAKLNGERLANARNLTAGAVIEAGTTTLTIAGFIDPNQDPSDVAEAAEAVKASDDDSAARLRAVEQLPLPEKGDEAPLAESTLMASDWDPTGDEVHTSTGALQPNRNSGLPRRPVIEAATPRPALGIDDADAGNATVAPGTFIAETTPLSPKRAGTAAPDTDALTPSKPGPSPTRSTRIKPITIRVGTGEDDSDDDAHPASPEATAPDLAEPGPASAAPLAPDPVQPAVVRGSTTATPGTDSQERTFYITVLGRRIGPLTRLDARDLKARELKGTLTTADLDTYPQS